MLPENWKVKKNKNVCVVFWLPCLPCENGEKRSKFVRCEFFEHRLEKFEKLAQINNKKCG